MLLILPLLFLFRVSWWTLKLTVFTVVILPWLLYCAATHRRHGVPVYWWLRL